MSLEDLIKTNIHMANIIEEINRIIREADTTEKGLKRSISFLNRDIAKTLIKNYEMKEARNE